MGCSYTAHTFVGICIARSKLHTTRRVKAFDHNYGEEMKFDPQTGKPLWENEESLVNGQEEQIECNMKFGEFDVLSVDDNHSDYLIGRGVSADDYGKRLVRQKPEELDIEGTKAALKEYLEPLGLWNEGAFGVYTFQYIGC